MAHHQTIPFLPPFIKLHHKVVVKLLSWAGQVLLLYHQEALVLLICRPALQFLVTTRIVTTYHPCPYSIALQCHHQPTAQSGVIFSTLICMIQLLSQMAKEEEARTPLLNTQKMFM
jgi:hypothetical protein